MISAITQHDAIWVLIILAIIVAFIFLVTRFR